MNTQKIEKRWARLGLLKDRDYEIDPIDLGGGHVLLKLKSSAALLQMGKDLHNCMRDTSFHDSFMEGAQREYQLRIYGKRQEGRHSTYVICGSGGKTQVFLTTLRNENTGEVVLTECRRDHNKLPKDHYPYIRYLIAQGNWKLQEEGNYCTGLIQNHRQIFEILDLPRYFSTKQSVRFSDILEPFSVHDFETASDLWLSKMDHGCALQSIRNVKVGGDLIMEGCNPRVKFENVSARRLLIDFYIWPLPEQVNIGRVFFGRMFSLPGISWAEYAEKARAAHIAEPVLRRLDRKFQIATPNL